MIPELFATDQAVTLSDPHTINDWEVITPPDGPIPVFGKIYHVAGYHPGSESDDTRYVILKELSHEDAWDQVAFAPVIDDNVLEKELQEAFTEPVLK